MQLIVELRVRPARLTAEIADFVDDCWGVGPVNASAPNRRPEPPGYRGAGGPGGSTMSRPVGPHQLISSSCQK